MGLKFYATDAAGNPTKIALNRGRQINLIDTITGVAAGGSGSATMSTDRRLHASKFQFVAVNYTGGTALATTATSGSGSGLTVTFTTTAGQPNAMTIGTAGTGYATNDTFSVADATGAGATFKVTAQSGGVPSAVAYTAGTGTPTPVNPASVCSLMKDSVGGTPVRDISPLFRLMIAQANGYNSVLGELPCFYTEPWTNILRGNDATSWDIAGQSSMIYQFLLNSGWIGVGITGIQEFDSRRNITTDATGKQTVNLEPVSYHLLTAQLAAGITPITNIDINYRLRRLWLLGATPGNLTYLQCLGDNQTIIEGTVTQINNRLKDYKFQLGQPTYENQTQTSQKTLGLNPINYFDTACIFDIDERYQKGLACASSLSLRLTSAVSQNVSIIIEALPGAYQ